jgi:hypothetical protein
MKGIRTVLFFGPSVNGSRIGKVSTYASVSASMDSCQCHHTFPTSMVHPLSNRATTVSMLPFQCCTFHPLQGWDHFIFWPSPLLKIFSLEEYFSTSGSLGSINCWKVAIGTPILPTVSVYSYLCTSRCLPQNRSTLFGYPRPCLLPNPLTLSGYPGLWYDPMSSHFTINILKQQ